MFCVDELQHACSDSHACSNSFLSLIMIVLCHFIFLRKFEFLMGTKCELLLVILLMMLQVYGE